MTDTLTTAQILVPINTNIETLFWTHIFAVFLHFHQNMVQKSSKFYVYSPFLSINSILGECLTVYLTRENMKKQVKFLEHVKLSWYSHYLIKKSLLEYEANLNILKKKNSAYEVKTSSLDPREKAEWNTS